MIRTDGCRSTAVFSRAAGSTQVVPVAPIPWELPARTPLRLSNVLPEGYDTYRWTVDGTEVSHDRTLEHTFEAPGTYRLDGYATRPAATDGDRHYVHVAYEVSVKVP